MQAVFRWGSTGPRVPTPVPPLSLGPACYHNARCGQGQEMPLVSLSLCSPGYLTFLLTLGVWDWVVRVGGYSLTG